MCFDSLNSSDIACGEYASRTLAGKQAPSMATQIASGGRICQRRRSLEFETHIFTLDP